MSILFAIGNSLLSDMLRKPLVENGFDVITDEVLHRDYLNELIEIQRPDMVIVHDYYLPSEFDKEPMKRDEEILGLIEEWRIKYPNLRVVILCIRERKDPFLASLVARNVLDIFHEKNLITKQFVDQLKEEPQFANVARYGTGDIELQFKEENEAGSDNGTPLSSEADSTNKVNPLVRQIQKGAKELKEFTQKRAETKALVKSTASEKLDETLFDEILDIMPIEKELSSKPTVIGTVLIAVAGVTNHLGATHTAISIASYLKELGHSVALVESNYSQDFDRIHALYEGEKKFLLRDYEFELRGLTHFKYRDDQDLNEIYSAYEYVVMDFGDLQEALNEDDFTRAHVKCVLCSADEWKYHWLKDFSKVYDIDNTYCFIVPGAGHEKIADLKEQIGHGTVVSFPIQDDPYKPEKEAGHVITKILGEFLKSPMSSSSRFILVATSAGSIAVTILLISIFKLLG